MRVKILYREIKIKNPHVKDTWRRRRDLNICFKYGHILTGPYYGLLQNHCRRCGAPNKCATDMTTYVHPWGEFK